MALFLYLLCQAIWTGAYADIKQWTSDTRFETPTNWASGRLPCSGQRASLAHSEALHVYLGSSVSVAGLILPRTGQLVLEHGASINFTNVDDSCKGEYI